MCTDDAGGVSTVDISFESLSFDMLGAEIDQEALEASLTDALDRLGFDVQGLCGLQLSAGSIRVAISVPRGLLNSLLEVLADGVDVTVPDAQSHSKNITASARLVKPLPVPRKSDICSALQTAATQEFCLCNPNRNCHECILEKDDNGQMVGSVCLVCKNKKLLHNGVCVDECPEGTDRKSVV